MPNIEMKKEVVSGIKEKLDKAASVVLVDGRGLTVFQDTSLRKKLREVGIDYKVYKNTMMELAIKDTQFQGLSEFLKGPTAVAISYDDATAAARIINKELKGLPNLEFKAAVVDGTVYDAKGVIAIADIPPRNELLSRLLGSFKSPVASFARIVKQIAEKDGGAVAPEPVIETAAAE